jgi:cobalt/nickel transport protein
MNTTKKLWIGIGILLLLSPLGVIIPALFHAGGAWGEWGPDEIEKILGYVPAGMKRLSKIWKAPLPDYAVPCQGGGLASEGMGYILTGIVGVVAAAGLMYLLAKMVARKNGAE